MARRRRCIVGLDPIDGEKDGMSGLVLLIILTALGVGMYSLLAGSSFARPLIVLVVLEAGSYSMFTSRHAPNIAPQSDENGVRGRVMNSASPFARTADTATKGGALDALIAPRNDAGAVATGQKLDVARHFQELPVVEGSKGRDGSDSIPQLGAQLAQANSKGSVGLVFEFPAPGCPKKLPTYESVAPICTPLDKDACNRNRLCDWIKDNINKCYAKAKGTLSSPPIDPADAARLGIYYPYAKVTTERASQHVARGDHYTANGKFRKAILEYTSALKEVPDSATFTSRASAYERIGDKNRAVRDYCEALASGDDFETYKRAKARIAQLTGQQPLQVPPPSLASPSANLPADLKPAKPPLTSTIERSRRRNAIAPLAIEGETGTNYLIKLVRVDGADSMLIFVRGGETYSTKIPLGTYNIRSAAGSIWYGRKDFFGPSTRFFRLRTKDGKQPNFTFSRQGNMIHGMRFQLKKVLEGNTEEETISRDEF